MATQPTSSLTDLILSMEEAILAAKQLPYASADPTRIHLIQSSLHRAHSQLSAFLSAAPPRPPPAEDPMQLEDDESSVTMVDGVEERMRNCFIRNKRPKRRFSPSSAAEEGLATASTATTAAAAVPGGFDPYATRSRALELVYQFHV